MCIAYMVKEVELYKQITKMGSRFIINIPKEYYPILKKLGLLDGPIKIKFLRSFSVKEVELYKQITKMGMRYIINIPNEYVPILEKYGLLDGPIGIKFSKVF